MDKFAADRYSRKLAMLYDMEREEREEREAREVQDSLSAIRAELQKLSGTGRPSDDSRTMTGCLDLAAITNVLKEHYSKRDEPCQTMTKRDG